MEPLINQGMHNNLWLCSNSKTIYNVNDLFITLVHHLFQYTWFFPFKSLELNYQYYLYYLWKILYHNWLNLIKNSMIMISRFQKNFAQMHLIDRDQRSINFNIFLFIDDISSNTINYNQSIFKPNCLIITNPKMVSFYNKKV